MKMFPGWMVLAALALAGCGGGVLEIEDLRVEQAEPYPGTPARVVGRVSLPERSSGTISVKVTFGDGTEATADLARSGEFTATHTYTQAGTFEVVATASTTGGATGARTSSVKVAEPVHSVHIECVTCDDNGACSALACDQITSSHVTLRAHAEGGIGAPRFRWTFGDGTLGGDGQTVTHEYRSRGTFPVTVVAADSVASSATATRDVVITNLTAVSVTIQGSTTTATVGNEVTFNLVATGEPPLTFIINWGDASNQVAANYPADGTALPVTHTYLTAGSYTLSVTAVDRVGQEGEATRTITVN